MQEEYFSAERLLELKIGSVVQILEERTGEHLTASLVGIDSGRMVITSIPASIKGDSKLSIKSLLNPNAAYEMKCIHEGKIIAWEASYKGIYQSRLLMTSFPEMVETRKLRQDTRFPCTLATDIRSRDKETYGVITNISAGGCQINVKDDEDFAIIEECFKSKLEVDLVVTFPPDDEAAIVVAAVKSSKAQANGYHTFGLAFRHRYDCIRRYLESLQQDSVAPFFR